jgi:hypothetical protein
MFHITLRKREKEKIRTLIILIYFRKKRGILRIL